MQRQNTIRVTHMIHKHNTHEHKAQVYITDNKKNIKNHYYLNKIRSNVECHTGNSRDIQFLIVNYTLICYFYF